MWPLVCTEKLTPGDGPPKVDTRGIPSGSSWCWTVCCDFESGLGADGLGAEGFAVVWGVRDFGLV